VPGKKLYRTCPRCGCARFHVPSGRCTQCGYTKPRPGKSASTKLDNSKKRIPAAHRAPVHAMLVVSSRLVPAIQLSGLGMTSMTRVSAAGAGETGPARRRANAHPAGHDGTLTRPCTHRREARRAQEKRKAPTKGGQLTTTAYVSVQDLRPKVWQPEAKSWTRVPLRTTPWALR
jgi:ribosomal protein L37E